MTVGAERPVVDLGQAAGAVLTLATAEVVAFVVGPHSDCWGLELPDAGEGMCCYGAAVFGAHRCTCWQPVYDLEQQPIDEQAAHWLACGIEPVTRRRMCGDCAYRPDAPERNGVPGFAGDAETLERFVLTGSRFWCHVGIRRALKWVHPSGAEVPGHAGDYDPPKRGGVPYRADGSPGEVCAGWDARRRALTSDKRTAVAL